MTTTASINSINSFLDTIRGEHGSMPWADDATLDAVVPGWRCATKGSAAIDRQFRAWFRDPGELEEVRHHATETGAVIELTVTWTEDGVPHAARQIHVLDLDDEGRIAHDAMWCGGRWPAQLLADMEAASDAG